MKSAIVRLFTITISCLLLIFFALFWLRFLGLQQNFAPLEHPLMETGEWYFLKNPHQHMNGDQISSWLGEGKMSQSQWIPWLDLRRSADGVWFLSPLEWVPLENGVQRAVHQLSFESVESHWPAGKPLKMQDLWEILQNRPAFLNFIEKNAHGAKELSSQIPPSRLANTFFRSPVYSFGKTLREELPEGFFITDPSTVTRVLLMNSLFLESMTSLWADGFMAPAEMQGRSVFSERLLAELKRRFIPVLLESSSGQELSPSLLDQMRGYAGESLEDLERIWSLKHPAEI